MSFERHPPGCKQFQTVNQMIKTKTGASAPVQNTHQRMHTRVVHLGEVLCVESEYNRVCRVIVCTGYSTIKHSQIHVCRVCENGRRRRLALGWRRPERPRTCHRNNTRTACGQGGGVLVQLTRPATCIRRHLFTRHASFYRFKSLTIRRCLHVSSLSRSADVCTVYTHRVRVHLR